MGDRVFIEVAPFKHMIRFGRKGKLAPKFINLYKIVKRVRKVAYRLTLLANMNCIHDVFHVFSLHKYISDISHVLNTKEIYLLEDLSYNERPI